MYSRTAHIRRTQASLRFNKRLAIMAVLGTAACVAALLPMHDDVPTPANPSPSMPAADVPVAASPRGVLFSDAKRQAAAQPRAVRHIYPYSIVPGGVTGQADLTRAIRSDPSVAAHYASFAVDKARLVTVARPRGVYVSYRKDGQIYWTAKKVMLAEGETLLSDGVNEIRTRCGNRISDVPQQPVARAEPSQEVLDTSIDMPADDGDDGVERVSMAQNIGTTDHGSTVLARSDAFPDAAGLNAGLRAAPAPDRVNPMGALGNPALASTNRDALPYALVGTPSTNTASTTSATTPTTATTASARPRSGTTGGASDTALTTLRDGLASTGTGSSATGNTDAAGGGTGAGDTASGASGAIVTGGSGAAAGSGTVASTAGSTSGSDTKTAATTPINGGPVAAPQAPTLVQQPVKTTPGKTPLQHADVPEPGSLWLGGLGFAAMLLLRRKRRAPGA